MNLIGPLPADTLFQDKYLSQADAVGNVSRSGLPVLKYMVPANQSISLLACHLFAHQ